MSDLDLLRDSASEPNSGGPVSQPQSTDLLAGGTPGLGESPRADLEAKAPVAEESAPIPVEIPGVKFTGLRRPADAESVALPHDGDEGLHEFEREAMDVEHMAMAAANPLNPADPNYTNRAEDIEPATRGALAGPGFAPDLSPEERDAQLDLLIAAESAANAAGQNYVLEFGALSKLERHLSTILREHLPEDVAEVASSRLRQGLHRISVNSPKLQSKEHTVDGVKARIEALGACQGLIGEHIAPLLQKFQAHRIPCDDALTSIQRAVEKEKASLEASQKSLAPETVGGTLFRGLMDVASALKKDRKTLVGDVRQDRNRQIRETLDGMLKVSDQLRTRAGDPEWVAAEGEQALNELRHGEKTIKALTRGVEDQIDFNALGAGMKNVSENVAAGAQSASDETFKKKLESMVKFIQQAVENITRAISNFIGVATPERAARSPSPR